VRAKLQTLFKQRNPDELGNLVTQLKKLEDPAARELVQLGLGYLDELSEQPERAFEHYAALIDLVRETVDTAAPSEDSQARLEDALGRMIGIAMEAQRYDQALLILQTLADLSPSYQPQLAELLRLNGDIDAAISTYNRYLSQAPSDLVCMLRLGRLYQSIGSKEAARTAFDYVLQQEPENTAARALLEQLENAA
jgi:tetratricopeptide (TPR) repeat protein